MDFGMVAVKLIAGFLGLWIMTRVLGKKEISQLTPFDFVSSMMLSEIVGNTIYQKDVSIIELLFSLVIWFALSYAFEKITQYAKKSRGPLEGTPSILIRNGKIDVKEMKDNRLDFEQLLMMLRQKDIFSVREVAYAIFETNGTLSVMKNSDYDSLQKGDLNIKGDDLGMTYSLLEDGVINEDTLQRLGKGQDWLLAMLREKGHPNPSKLAYVEWQQGRGLYVLEHKLENQRLG
ncbi:DUF421 domain-containing protein [Paenibacillus pini]|uniref:DUF421 domain-containing protein n=1 Tax=Paenibacillus pini JCM 16418 TaxID=1236976 RepID=W7YXN7_9BACL|nr:DUF421 domain-containing protein [Paenibacillus pini]GAF09446.1 hypothetical protein JCM16418_3587 [Paenibacillus pini JCM 16418]